MALNRGNLLERQFIASLPAGRVWVHKLHTPVPVGTLLAYVKGINHGRVPERLMGVLASTFTAKEPFDLLVVAPVEIDFPGWQERRIETFKAPGGGTFELVKRPTISFAFELKSCGEEKNLAFDRVKEHQLAGLLEAAARGIVAGLIIEFSEVGPDGELYFLPAAMFAAYKASADRVSLPLAAAQEHGILIEVDHGRGRVHRFWKVSELLIGFGAHLPPTMAR